MTTGNELATDLGLKGVANGNELLDATHESKSNDPFAAVLGNNNPTINTIASNAPNALDRMRFQMNMLVVGIQAAGYKTLKSANADGFGKLFDQMNIADLAEREKMRMIIVDQVMQYTGTLMMS